MKYTFHMNVIVFVGPSAKAPKNDTACLLYLSFRACEYRCNHQPLTGRSPEDSDGRARPNISNPVSKCAPERPQATPILQAVKRGVETTDQYYSHEKEKLITATAHLR